MGPGVRFLGPPVSFEKGRSGFIDHVSDTPAIRPDTVAVARNISDQRLICRLFERHPAPRPTARPPPEVGAPCAAVDASSRFTIRTGASEFSYDFLGLHDMRVPTRRI
jgi:hypothetical protein